MKILHYLFGLPPVYSGGLVNYALDLAASQTADAQVYILIPGRAQNKHKDNIKIITADKKYKKIKNKMGINEAKVFSIDNTLPVSYGRGVVCPDKYMDEGDERVYRDFLIEIAPDVIHVHSIMGIHQEFFTVARGLGIPIVYTTHDFYGICMNAKLFREDVQGGCVCRNTSGSDCGMCCKNSWSYKRIVFEQSGIFRFLKETGIYDILSKNPLLKRVIQRKKKVKTAEPLIEPDGSNDRMELCETACDYAKLKQYYNSFWNNIDYFLYNSSQTERIYLSCMSQIFSSGKDGECGEKRILGKNIGMSDRHIYDRRKKKNIDKILKIGYVGGNKRAKGYETMLTAADHMYESGYKDFKIYVYGDFEPQREYLEKKQKYNAQSMKMVYTDMDLLIVPSIWPETFGLVAIEALSFGTPVVVSALVGAKDVLGSVVADKEYGVLCEYGIIYNNSRRDLYHAFMEVYNTRKLVYDMNQRIIESDKIESYFWKEHTEKVKDIYNSIVNGKELRNE